MFRHDLRFVASDHIERENRFLKKEETDLLRDSASFFRKRFSLSIWSLAMKRRSWRNTSVPSVPLCLCVEIALQHVVLQLVGRV